MSCGLLDLIPHVIVAIKVKHVCHQVQCILIILNVGIQSSEIESIREVILVYLTEVLVAT